MLSHTNILIHIERKRIRQHVFLCFGDDTMVSYIKSQYHNNYTNWSEHICFGYGLS